MGPGRWNPCRAGTGRIRGSPRQALTLLAYLGYMWNVHAGLPLTCLATTPLLWLGAIRFSRRVQPAYRRASELADQVVTTLVENVSGAQGVKGFGRQAEEIAKFERDSAKSGNLLHASRGVKARASQGTTPWFAQIFSYAINGITDDEGWHVTHADLPQWIEFALRAARPIRRVVLHTPNLRDYDLQFRGAGSMNW